MATIRLKKGRVRPVWAGHPWVFAQAIDHVEGAPAPGDEVSVSDPEGKLLGRGFWSPKSAIPIRILSREPGQTLSPAWLADRIAYAGRWRREILDLPNRATSGYRLVHGEGDGLGGLIVDVYQDTAVVQLLTIGMKRREEDVFAAVARVTGCMRVVEAVAGNTNTTEGFVAEHRTIRGSPAPVLEFSERGLRFEIPDEISQKTGYYFDQRENRAWVESLARGRRVLDAFCYVGGFALAAARGGAKEVIAIDSSAPAVSIGAAIAHRNGMAVTFVRGDIKKEFVRLVQAGERFDLVIVDPPKLAPTRRHLDAGSAAYQRLNENALKLVTRGGLLLSCSCSSAVTPDALFRIIGVAARNVGRTAVLLGSGQQAPDHPILIPFVEGRYLTSLLVRVD